MDKKKRTFLIIAAVGIFALLFVAESVGIGLAQEGSDVVSASIVSTEVNYQGMLTASAGGLLNGTYTMTFNLYDVLSGGAALDTDTHSVEVENGLFNTEINFDQGFFDGRALWLGIMVGTDSEMTPRQELRPVPYALSLVPGAVITGSLSGPVLKVNSNGNHGQGVYAKTDGDNSAGVFARTDGDNSKGVWAWTSGDNSQGVLATTDGKQSAGVYAYTSGEDSKGVYAEANGDNSEGVYAKTTGKDSPAVYGYSKQDVGVYGEGKEGGYFEASGGDGCGVYGEATGRSGYGVKGWASDEGDVENYGGHFTAAGSRGIGVYGWAENEGSGENYGGYFVAEGDGGTGVYAETDGDGSEGFYAHTTGFSSEGFYAYTTGNGSEGFYAHTIGDGSEGFYAHTTGSSSEGVYAYTEGDYSEGVYARTEGEYSKGVYAEANGDNSAGVLATTDGKQSAGVYAYTSGKQSAGVYAGTNGYNSTGVYAYTTSKHSKGVYARTYGEDSTGVSIHTNGDNSEGVWASTSGEDSTGVYAQVTGEDSAGVWAYSKEGIGVIAVGKKTGIHAYGDEYAAEFDGNVIIHTGRTITPVLEITGGSDLSEQFEIRGIEAEVSPSSGMLVSIDPEHPGELVVSNNAYDRRVAGIISGAGGLNPGMLMGQKDSEADGGYPVALSGRVYCWSDASNGPIEPGDLLTTSETPGHAMKVIDHDRSHGAIIGKAMTDLEEGKGLVLVLVALQ